MPTSWRNGASEVLLVQAPGSGSLKQTRQIKLSGHLIGSRRIGSTIYMVLRSYPQTLASSTSTVKTADYLPTISVDGAADQPLVDPSACLLQTGNASASADLITLVAIGLATDKHTHAGINHTSGNVWVWSEDWSGCVACSIGFDVFWVYSCRECGEEFEFETYSELEEFSENNQDDCTMCRTEEVTA
jgi:hypothetical protein